MIFQNPMTALNPLWTIGYHLTEVICRYSKDSNAEAEKIAVPGILVGGKMPSSAARASVADQMTRAQKMNADGIKNFNDEWKNIR